MPTAIIRLVLKWLAGITAEQWEDALRCVVDLATAAPTGDSKAQAFTARLASLYAHLPTWAINLLREAAVAFARKKGWIA